MSNWKQLLLNPHLKLENSRAAITHLSHIHLKSLTEIGCNPKIWTYNSRFNCQTEEEIKGYIDRALHFKEQFERIPFVIFDKAVQRYAGSTSFYGMNDEYRKLGIGYTWYGVDFQRTGLNKAVKSLMYDFAFNTLQPIPFQEQSYLRIIEDFQLIQTVLHLFFINKQCTRVEYHINSNNQASRQSVERYGGKLDGIIRNDCRRYNGENVDTALYSILPQEYEQVKEKLVIS